MKRYYEEAFNSQYCSQIMVKTRQRRVCALCKLEENQFVYDAVHDDTICTYCGCVQSKSFNYIQYDVFNDPVEPIKQNKKVKYQQKINHQLMDVIDREGVKNRKFHAMLADLSYRLDLNERTKSRVESMFNNFEQLSKIKPLETVIVALLIISQKEQGMYVNEKEIGEKLNIKKLNKMVNKISTDILKIDNDSYTASSIPMCLCLMGIDSKNKNKNKSGKDMSEEQIIRLMFERASKKNTSMGSDTILALCLYIRMKQLKLDETNDKINLEFIASITKTSLNSLHGYINKKTKCTLF